jgi:hypothetical protein
MLKKIIHKLLINLIIVLQHLQHQDFETILFRFKSGCRSTKSKMRLSRTSGLSNLPDTTLMFVIDVLLCFLSNLFLLSQWCSIISFFGYFHLLSFKRMKYFLLSIAYRYLMTIKLQKNELTE